AFQASRSCWSKIAKGMPAEIRQNHPFCCDFSAESVRLSSNRDRLRHDSYQRRANATPRPYVIPASMIPTIVISAPLAHQDRVATSAFEAPTTKCAAVLMTNDAMTAGMPTAKKNGMIGMKPPTAVETLAESVERHGFGNVSSLRPSSSCVSARRNCFGSFEICSAMRRDSSAENPLSW